MKTPEIHGWRNRGKRLGLAGGILLAIFILGSGDALAKKTAPPSPEPRELLQVKVHRLVTDPNTGQPVVFLEIGRAHV